MNLSKTTLGAFELYTIETGHFMLDGGAMFGVVPKTLWSRGITPDEKNRIPMTMRCLLVKSTNTGKVYLIDNGVGTKFDEKMTGIYSIDTSMHTLEASLAHQGFSKEDITDIIFTHLHFDHCGGTTYFDDNGELAFSFPQADMHVHKAHWETATHPNAREKASFLKENIDPLTTSDKLHLVETGHEFEPGLSTIVANGHTLGMQLLKIEGDNKTIVFMADLIATHVHLPLPWVMGYDMFPNQTLIEKEEFLKNAVSDNWYLYLEHDIQQEIIRVAFDGRKYSVSETLTLNEV